MSVETFYRHLARADSLPASIEEAIDSRTDEECLDAIASILETVHSLRVAPMTVIRRQRDDLAECWLSALNDSSPGDVLADLMERFAESKIVEWLRDRLMNNGAIR